MQQQQRLFKFMTVCRFVKPTSPVRFITNLKKKQKQFLIAALVHRLCLQAHVSLFAFNTAHNINANYN